MTDTIFRDISEFQQVVNNSYTDRWISIRSNDGTYRDAHFAANIAWIKSKLGNTLDAFIVYVVYRPGKDWVGTLKSQVGTPDPRMAVMVDVENWNGAIKGDHSADINAGVSAIASWLGSLNRVLGYGNASDLNSIWPNKALAPNHIVLANYVSNAAYPNKIIHQYQAGVSGGTAMQGDLNSADGLGSAQLMDILGLTGAVNSNPPANTANPSPSAPPFPLPNGYYYGDASGPVQSVSGKFPPYGGPNGAPGLREWQQQMRNRGNVITVDGIDGPETQRITVNFQAQCGVTQDKKIGPVTWALAWTAPITSQKL